MARTVTLVPGFLGTELTFQNALNQTVPLWLNKVLLARDGFLPLAFEPDGDTPLKGKGKACEPGNVFGDFYTSMRDRLRTGMPANYNKRLFIYDWRKDPRRVGNALADAIRQESTATEPAYIVGHSLGGMIAVLAYKALKATGQQNLIKKIVTLGTPHYGCYAIADAYALRDSFVNDLARLSALLSLSGGLNRLTQDDAKRIKDDVIRTLNTWPSAYAMMPMRGPVQQTYDPNVQWWYTEDKMPTDLYIDWAWMAWTTLTFQPTYYEAANNPPPNVLKCVAGMGVQTIQKAINERRLMNVDGYLWNEDGDGVVPVWSATAASTNREIVNGQHALLPQNPLVLEKIIAWLMEEAAPEPLPIDVLIVDGQKLVPAPNDVPDTSGFFPALQPPVVQPGTPACAAGGCKC